MYTWNLYCVDGSIRVLVQEDTGLLSVLDASASVIDSGTDECLLCATHRVGGLDLDSVRGHCSVMS